MWNFVKCSDAAGDIRAMIFYINRLVAYDSVENAAALVAKLNAQEQERAQ